MDIKKASDKPMIIHQKQKAELHICHNKEMKPRPGNIKRTNRSPKIKSATWIVNTFLDNFFKVIFPILYWCLITK